MPIEPPFELRRCQNISARTRIESRTRAGSMLTPSRAASAGEVVLVTAYEKATSRSGRSGPTIAAIPSFTAFAMKKCGCDRRLWPSGNVATGLSFETRLCFAVMSPATWQQRPQSRNRSVPSSRSSLPRQQLPRVVRHVGNVYRAGVSCPGLRCVDRSEIRRLCY